MQVERDYHVFKRTSVLLPDPPTPEPAAPGSRTLGRGRTRVVGELVWRETGHVRVVRFPAYRQYEATRTEASNAMMALLAGAQLAGHLLQLTEGSDRLLPEVFPRVAHIGRFNLTSEAAREILADADSHLGAMSVPYALSIHEDFLKTCLALLAQARRCTSDTAVKARLFNAHAWIEKATGGTFTVDSVLQLHTLRAMRNCQIHDGGRASTVLLDTISAWTAGAEAGWVRQAKRSPRRLKLGNQVDLGQAELILTLAVTKTLAREANELLQPALSRQMWADILIDDLFSADLHAQRAPDRLRRARGLARFHYTPLRLTDQEITASFNRQP